MIWDITPKRQIYVEILIAFHREVVQKVALPMLSEFQKDKVLLSEKFREIDAFAYHGYGAIDFFFLLYSI